MWYCGGIAFVNLFNDALSPALESSQEARHTGCNYSKGMGNRIGQSGRREKGKSFDKVKGLERQTYRQ